MGGSLFLESPHPGPGHRSSDARRIGGERLQQHWLRASSDCGLTLDLATIRVHLCRLDFIFPAHVQHAKMSSCLTCTSQVVYHVLSNASHFMCVMRSLRKQA